MRVLFIRHGDALPAGAGGDMARPLSDEGREMARSVALAVKRTRGPVARIYTSPALRARETAEVLASVLEVQDVVETGLLEPGSRIGQLRELIAPCGPDDTVIAVGHEPDFSEMISALTGNGVLNVKVGKLSVAEVLVNREGEGMLMALIPADVAVATAQ